MKNEFETLADQLTLKLFETSWLSSTRIENVEVADSEPAIIYSESTQALENSIYLHRRMNDER